MLVLLETIVWDHPDQGEKMTVALRAGSVMVPLRGALTFEDCRISTMQTDQLGEWLKWLWLVVVAVEIWTAIESWMATSSGKRVYRDLVGGQLALFEAQEKRRVLALPNLT